MVKSTDIPKWTGYILTGIGGALLGYLLYRSFRGDNYNCPHCGYPKVPNNSQNCPHCGVLLKWLN